MGKKSSVRVLVRLARLSKLLIALCELMLGVVLLIDPAAFSNMIMKGLGVVLLVMGLICILRYCKAPQEEAVQEQALTEGLLLVIGGVFCLIRSSWIIETFPLLPVLYGLITLVNGVAKVQWAVDLLREKAVKWFLAALSAAVTLASAAVILYNPFPSTDALWIFIGVSLVAEAVFDVIGVLFSRVARIFPERENQEIIDAVELLPIADTDVQNHEEAQDVGGST